jgi:hypothetical protein
MVKSENKGSEEVEKLCIFPVQPVSYLSFILIPQNSYDQFNKEGERNR